MAYEKTNWQARTGSGLNRFVDQDGNILVLTAAPTEVITPGTPFSADNMNHMEDGIEGAYGLLVTGLSLPTTGYSGSGPYTIDITATGVEIGADKVYKIEPDLSDTDATAALQQESWNLIIGKKSIPSANTLRLKVSEVPTTACPFYLYEIAMREVE